VPSLAESPATNNRARPEGKPAQQSGPGGAVRVSQASRHADRGSDPSPARNLIAGVTAHRPGALERVYLAMSAWHNTRARLADAEARMVAVLDELGLTGLITTIAD
jgi:hypothetical protein